MGIFHRKSNEEKIKEEQRAFSKMFNLREDEIKVKNLGVWGGTWAMDKTFLVYLGGLDPASCGARVRVPIKDIETVTVETAAGGWILKIVGKGAELARVMYTNPNHAEQAQGWILENIKKETQSKQTKTEIVDSKVCPYCGKYYQDKPNYCPNCGKKLKVD